ncbi:MAG TPA: hypothetical protein VK212_03900 [Lentimicrobium sp.]|nr:hypothetical protein [Lentimicrobium sp.]
MKSGILISLILFTLICYSCKPDDDEKAKMPVYAGITNSEMQYTELNPPIAVEVYHDTTNSYYYGSDSIDIEQDGTFDIIIRVGYFDDDTIYYPTQNFYPFTSLTVKDSIQFATEVEYYPMGLGTTGKIYWIDTLSYNQRIDDINTWYSDYLHQFMWVVPPSYFWGSNGTWYDLSDTEKYIGMRIKRGNEYKYGWIKVFAVSSEVLLFKSFAIQN